MKVVDPGRVYELTAGNGLIFLHNENGVVREGTTIEEVLEVLIDRVTEAYQMLPCHESIRALYLLREALAEFRTRSARRASANVEGTYQPHEAVFESVDTLMAQNVSPEADALDQAPN